MAAVVRVWKSRGGMTGDCFVKTSLIAPATRAAAPIASGMMVSLDAQLVSPLLNPTSNDWLLHCQPLSGNVVQDLPPLRQRSVVDRHSQIRGRAP